MSNDRLIEQLAGDLQPVTPRRFASDALILASLCAIELTLFLGLGPTRPDMPMAMDQPSFWWKFASLGAIAVIAATIAILSLNPVASPRRGLRGLLGVVAACLAIAWVVGGSRGGMQSLAARLDWRGGLACVAKMVVLSMPAVAGLALLIRRGAPTDPRGTALAAGIAAAAWGAFVFVFACPHDDPLYIALWYSVGCGIVIAFSRLALPQLMRW